MERFGSLGAVLHASPEAQALVARDPRVVEHLGALSSGIVHVLRPSRLSSPVLGNGSQLLDYLRARLAHAGTERVQVIYLNRTNHVLGDEELFRGTVAEVPFYAREILRRSIELGASGIVVAHNHPSGDPTPSSGDVTLTRRLADVAQALDIELHDHVVISRSGFVSMRAEGLI